jgi:hypothetical protein
LNERETAYLREKVTRLRSEWKLQRNNQIKALKLNLKRSKERLNRLTDAFLDGVIEKELFENRKQAILNAQTRVRANDGEVPWVQAAASWSRQ